MHKPLVFYLHSSFLEVFPAGKQGTRFLFTPDLVKHAEIVDRSKFFKSLSQFFAQLNLKKGNGVVILAPELVFASEIAAAKDGQSAIDKFLSLVPISKHNRATIIHKTKTTLGVYAANQALYQLVIDVSKEHRIAIFSVVPVTAFTHASLDGKMNIQKLAGEKKIIEAFNFLQSKQPDAPKAPAKDELVVEVETQKNMAAQYALLGLSLFLLAAAVGYLLLWSETIPNPWFKTVAPTQVNLTPSPTAVVVPSPVQVIVDKSTLKIQILNGSGIAGQAGKLGSLLEGAGYKNITIGNAAAVEANTRIEYASAVPQSVRDEVVAIINKDFPSATAQEATQSAGYDLLVTLGQK